MAPRPPGVGTTSRSGAVRRSQAARSSAGGRSAWRPGFSPVVMYAVTAPTSSQNAAGRAAGENSARHCSHVANSDCRSNPSPSAAWPKTSWTTRSWSTTPCSPRAADAAPRTRSSKCHRAALAKLGTKLGRTGIRIVLAADVAHPDTETAVDDLEQSRGLALERPVGAPDGVARCRGRTHEPVRHPLGRLGRQEARRSQHGRRGERLTRQAVGLALCPAPRAEASAGDAARSFCSTMQ